MCTSSTPYVSVLFAWRRWQYAITHPLWASYTAGSVLRHHKLVRAHLNVEGLIDWKIGILLWETVLKAKSNSVNIVEIGAYKGRSTIYLSLEAAQVGKRVKSFELFSGLPELDMSLDSRFCVGQFSSSVVDYEKM